MSTVLRPRLDITCALADGRTFMVSTTIRDLMRLKAFLKSQGAEPSGDPVDICRMAYFAAARTHQFDGSWEDWAGDDAGTVDGQLVDFQADEPPPLVVEATSPVNSQPSPGQLESLHAS